MQGVEGSDKNMRLTEHASKAPKVLRAHKDELIERRKQREKRETCCWTTLPGRQIKKGG